MEKKMEKKVYEKPSIEKVEFDFAEITTASPDPEDPDDWCQYNREWSWKGTCKN